MNTNIKSLLLNIKDFIVANKKSLICFSLLFIVGIVIGIVHTVSITGEFEQISKSEMSFASVKIFFFSSLLISIGYILIAISSCIYGLSFISIIPFPILGFVFGKYMTLLIGNFGGVGILNLTIIYIPFFIGTFILLAFAGALALSQANICSCKEKTLLRPSIISVIKCYIINIAFNFIIFVVVGCIVGVVVVS